MIDSLVILKLKGNQISFDQIPERTAIKVKNYDVGRLPLLLEEDRELQFKLGVEKDTETGEWYKLDLYTETKYEGLDQLELPIEEAQA